MPPMFRKLFSCNLVALLVSYEEGLSWQEYVLKMSDTTLSWSNYSKDLRISYIN